MSGIAKTSERNAGSGVV